MQPITAPEFTSILKQGTYTVKFEKVNGEMRTMHCTRDTNYIPINFHPKGEGKTYVPTTVPVFDIDEDGWRSIRVDFIKEIERVVFR